jgi:hypothetical protein
VNVAFVAALLLQGGDSVLTHRVDGRVVRGTRTEAVPVVAQWVVLHRIASDRSGPLDSTRTGADGRYVFRYTTTPRDTAAIYFATTSHGGIVYPTAPFRGLRISSEEGTITVFDTTSGPVPIKVGGRHVIVGARQANGRYPIGEVYDLENDSTVTLIARDSTTPIYTARLPAGVENFQVNTSGAIGAGAASRRGTTVGIYAPISPGIRQFAFTYELPGKSFPLEISADAPVGVFEVLIEDPKAEVRAPAIREVEPARMEGRAFRRFLAPDVPKGGVVFIDVPRVAIAERQKVYIGVGLVVFAAMGVALIYAARRPRASSVAVPAFTEPRSRVLVRAIAELDDALVAAAATDEARAEFNARRAALKAQLADALAAERGRT